ncbi:MAG: SDR family oxidoreductase [Aestuariivirga sp.]
MNHILFFGFGFSAEALTRKLDRNIWTISGTSRSAEGVDAINAQGFRGLLFDELTAIPDDVTHIVSSVPPNDSGDPVIQKFGAELSKRARGFQWVAYLSTTGVYGDHGGAVVDETTPLTPNTDRGSRRVAAEAAWNAIDGLPLHIFRLAGIYGPGRNALENVKDGSAKRVIKAGQIFSRIHVEDIAGVLLASINKPRAGAIYNMADDEPCPPQDVIAYAAQLLNVPVPPDIPFEEAKLSAMARSFYADSKRVSNDLVKRELGYSFKYPNYRDGLKAILHQPAGPDAKPFPE